MKSLKYLCFVAVSLVLLNCKEDTKDNTEEKSVKATEKFSAIQNLPSSEAGIIVKKAIDLMGGMENWENKKTLSYTKTIRFFDSTGRQVREIKQLHEYQLRPQLKIKISWEEDGDTYESINNGSQAWKLKNGVEMTSKEDKKAAWNSTFGGHYVATIPFKLTDKGTNLNYLGVDSLNGKSAHIVKTTYSKGAGSSAGIHTWWYYFDENTYQPVGNFLDYGDGFSLTINESFTDVDGIQLPHKRMSYKTNADREMLYLTTYYINEAYKFDRAFDNNYFDKD